MGVLGGFADPSGKFGKIWEASRNVWGKEGEGLFWKALQRCIENANNLFAVLDINLQAENLGHANILLFNLERREVYRYEPHGMFSLAEFYTA